MLQILSGGRDILTFFPVMASSLQLPDLAFLSPKPTLKKHRFCLIRYPISRISLSRNHVWYSFAARTRVRASEEGSAGVEEREAELLREVNGSLKVNGNGAASAVSATGTAVLDAKFDYNELSERYGNGGLSVVESEGNGSVVKYLNGNGAAAAAEEVVEEEDSEDVRKKRIEDIGKEEAWFKGSAQEQVEVLHEL